MGTTFRIALYVGASEKAKADAAVEVAFTRLAELNAIFSDYEPNSEINRLLSGLPAPWAASRDLLSLTSRSLAIAQNTDGAFDPTIGHLTRLWRSTRQRGKLPPADRLQTALSTVDWRHIQLDSATRSISVNQNGLLLDYGGIAKGYAADQMLSLLKERGFPTALVQAGGDTAAGVAPPGTNGWPVTLRSGVDDTESETLHLVHRSVSTSGDLHQFIDIEGVRYSHIIDPKTGLGLTRRIACSVIANDTTTSDALATALCILGPENGRAIARQLHLTVHWTWLDEIGARHQSWCYPQD